jgi:hypothetical protein
MLVVDPLAHLLGIGPLSKQIHAASQDELATLLRDIQFKHSSIIFERVEDNRIARSDLIVAYFFLCDLVTSDIEIAGGG